MAQRMAQIKSDNVQEVAIFILRPDETTGGKGCTSKAKKPNPDGGPTCPCSNKWFPLLRDYLAGR